MARIVYFLSKYHRKVICGIWMYDSEIQQFYSKSVLIFCAVCKDENVLPMYK